ncbi:radical SAM protein [Candidatus Sumerlaeota bacterium]|nr:radical SAM protein [Candidatus Sumerlaeota bacterium]
MACQYLLDRQDAFPARTHLALRRVRETLRTWREGEIGGEAIPHGSRGPVALLFPNTYAVGMANIGVHWVWRAVNDFAEDGEHPFACERFFLDHLPALSVESERSLSDFPLILVSCAFELDYWNIARALLAAGIPLRARDRAREGGPVVVIGGLCTSVNRLPLLEFADAFAIGDGERALPLILHAWLRAGGEREPFLDHIEGRAGLEVPPRFTEAERARLIPDVARPEPSCVSESDCSTQILSPHAEFPGRALIEISRGCPYRCQFCYVGHRMRPYRNRSLDQIWRAVERWRPHTDLFGFVSSAVASHHQIDDLCRRCLDEGLKVSFSSLRAEDLTPLMVETLVASDQRTLTLAPEVASPRLRPLIHKEIDDETLETVIGECVRRGIENIKLYYMFGLPGESDDDAMAIVSQAERLRSLMTDLQRSSGRLGELSLNIGIFVPKAGTPLAGHALWDPGGIRKRRQRLLRAVRQIPNTRAAISGLEEAQLQCLVSMGGFETGDLLESLALDARSWKRHLRDAFPAWRERYNAERTAPPPVFKLPGGKRRVRLTVE